MLAAIVEKCGQEDQHHTGCKDGEPALGRRRQHERQQLDRNMPLSCNDDAGADKDDPDHQIKREFFRPGNRREKKIPHDDIGEEQKTGKCERAADEHHFRPAKNAVNGLSQPCDRIGWF